MSEFFTDNTNNDASPTTPPSPASSAFSTDTGISVGSAQQQYSHPQQHHQHHNAIKNVSTTHISPFTARLAENHQHLQDGLVSAASEGGGKRLLSAAEAVMGAPLLQSTTDPALLSAVLKLLDGEEHAFRCGVHMVRMCGDGAGEVEAIRMLLQGHLSDSNSRHRALAIRALAALVPPSPQSDTIVKPVLHALRRVVPDNSDGRSDADPSSPSSSNKTADKIRRRLSTVRPGSGSSDDAEGQVIEGRAALHALRCRPTLVDPDLLRLLVRAARSSHPDIAADALHTLRIASGGYLSNDSDGDDSGGGANSSNSDGGKKSDNTPRSNNNNNNTGHTSIGVGLLLSSVLPDTSSPQHVQAAADVSTLSQRKSFLRRRSQNKNHHHVIDRINTTTERARAELGRLCSQACVGDGVAPCRRCAAGLLGDTSHSVFLTIVDALSRYSPNVILLSSSSSSSSSLSDHDNNNTINIKDNNNAYHIFHRTVERLVRALDGGDQITKHATLRSTRTLAGAVTAYMARNGIDININTSNNDHDNDVHVFPTDDINNDTNNKGNNHAKEDPSLLLSTVRTLTTAVWNVVSDRCAFVRLLAFRVLMRLPSSVVDVSRVVERFTVELHINGQWRPCHVNQVLVDLSRHVQSEHHLAPALGDAIVHLCTYAPHLVDTACLTAILRSLVKQGKGSQVLHIVYRVLDQALRGSQHALSLSHTLHRFLAEHANRIAAEPAPDKDVHDRTVEGRRPSLMAVDQDRRAYDVHNPAMKGIVTRLMRGALNEEASVRVVCVAGLGKVALRSLEPTRLHIYSFLSRLCQTRPHGLASHCIPIINVLDQVYRLQAYFRVLRSQTACRDEDLRRFYEEHRRVTEQISFHTYVPEGFLPLGRMSRPYLAKAYNAYHQSNNTSL